MNLIYDFIHCRAILNREIQTIERRNYFLSLNYEYCDGSCNYVYKLATSPLCLRVPKVRVHRVKALWQLRVAAP